MEENNTNTSYQNTINSSPNVQNHSLNNDFARLVEESRKYFPNELGEFIYYLSYSKWIPELNRRETWVETVDRYINFMKETIREKLSTHEYEELKQQILNMKIIPSMRLLWSAGPAARRTNVTAYNCSYIAVTKPEDFGEIMYISMCGTGVGFSVEKKFIDNFPEVKMQTGDILPRYVIEDSKEGWAKAFVHGVKTWLDGKNLIFDFSQLRPKGARLKTMGGRSSGPEPLIDLIDFTRRKILSKQGQKLTSLDIHDICCKIGEIVISGGVRRSAMISLSDLEDYQMRHAKDGQFYIDHPHRIMSNNSAVYEHKPDSITFLKEWTALASSGSGERGIFNRGGLEKQLPKRRWEVFKDHANAAGTNPCGEIVLRSKQFCNLTSIVAREHDTLETLKEKIKGATILGTYQAMLTNFDFLSPEWKKNCEEERLLGVSFTGLWDCPVLRNPDVLRELKEYAIEINRIYSERFGINPSTCITTVKPSGNSSQLLDTASGLHVRHAPYYIRRVRISSTDPLFKLLRDQGFPHHPEVGQKYETATTFVLEFPIKSPENAKFKNGTSAIEQLEVWKMCKVNYTEHNPSVTISVGKDEWVETGNWIYENWDIVGGLSFLPKDEGDFVYELAPYETITKEKYEELIAKLPKIDYSKLTQYELEDETNGSKEYACTGDKCEIK